MDGFPERALGRRTPLEIAITVDGLLNELEKESPQRRAVVELKFFLGMTDEESADALNLKETIFMTRSSRSGLVCMVCGQSRIEPETGAMPFALKRMYLLILFLVVIITSGTSWDEVA